MTRPDPELLLKKIEDEEKQENKTEGRLKIFLGFCAGVGKTYKMLSEARAALKNGTDVAIGIVETHGRQETEKLLNGLPVIPRVVRNYNGITLDELDLDEVLRRKPKLVVIDELAHTNIRGSRHAKRYQDVMEIIAAGIDVYTTLNIQHVESQVDIVQQISEVKIRETVPDSVINAADAIELIDIPPEKLLERLHEGKIYIPESARKAADNFFKEGNLLALRELSLRFVAQHVDAEIIDYKSKNAIEEPWPVASKILVGFNAAPSSQRLLRITHRIASDMNAEWFAVYVEAPQTENIREKSGADLNKNIRLAEKLGAKTVVLSGNNVADAISGFAKEKNVTLIVAGLSEGSRLRGLFGASVVEELTRKSGSINVLVVGNETENARSEPPKAQGFSKISLLPYFLSVSAVSAIICAGYRFKDTFEPLNTALLLFLPVVLFSVFYGTAAGLFTAFLGIAAFDFFLVPPFMTFEISDMRYFPSFFVFIAVSALFSYLSRGIRRRSESARHRERFLASLNEFTRETLISADTLKSSATHIAEAFQCEAVILLPDEKKQLKIREKVGETPFERKEYAVAHWVYKNGKPAGKETDTLSSAKWLYMPLSVEDNVFGVLGINYGETLSPEQKTLLESFAHIIALYLKKM